MDAIKTHIYDLIQEEIGKNYWKYPFHNPLHGVKVADAMINMLWEAAQMVQVELELDWKKELCMIELERILGWCHDVARNDDIEDLWHEERSIEEVSPYLRSIKLPEENIQKLLHINCGTKLAERGFDSMTHIQKIAADADLWHLWSEDFSTYVEEVLRYFYELREDKYASIAFEEIQDFYESSEQPFYKNLILISKDSSHPYLTNEAKLAFPNFQRNKQWMEEILQTEEGHWVSLCTLVRSIQEEYLTLNSWS